MIFMHDNIIINHKKRCKIKQGYWSLKQALIENINGTDLKILFLIKIKIIMFNVIIIILDGRQPWT